MLVDVVLRPCPAHPGFPRVFPFIHTLPKQRKKKKEAKEGKNNHTHELIAAEVFHPCFCSNLAAVFGSACVTCTNSAIIAFCCEVRAAGMVKKSCQSAKSPLVAKFRSYVAARARCRTQKARMFFAMLEMLCSCRERCKDGNGR